MALIETHSALENTDSVDPEELKDTSTSIEEAIVETNTSMIADHPTDCQYDALYNYIIPTPNITPEDSLLSMGLQTSTSDQIYIVPVSDNMDFMLKDVKKTNSELSPNDQDHLLNNCFNTPEDSLSSLHNSKERDEAIDLLTSESLDSTSQSSVNVKDNLENSMSSLNITTEMDALLDLSTSSPSISSSQSTVTNFEDKTITKKQALLPKPLNQNEKIEVVTTNDNLNISQEILKFAKIPQLKPKKRKVETSEVTVNTVKKVIEILQKKENEKILKRTQIEMNKKKKEDKRALKDKEKTVAKSFLEKNKHLNNKKKDINSQIEALKISKIQNEVNKENQSALQDQLNTLIKYLEEIERELINVEVQSLQSKIKIKTEKC